MAGAIASAIYQHVSPSPGPPINGPDRSLLALLTRYSRTVSRGLIRRNAVYLTSIFAGAFAFEIAFDSTTNKIWDTMNRGRQWKDIKYQYVNKAEEEDDE
ncbi:hypothetical protein P175DRAFT_0557352 [Aspergillus ochraceoroseus IBT 24754]|uniref:Complex III subunit 9 n=2 Tax=Aspergillus ochraceoroseus TaxID=138278 RepID=A0A2T5LWK9_9EURO|nr:uncharacterized protein P175DRAFT_0557352 [Aspergillus ochraceoroseus IBT 24754]KKK23168.1 hypothetical protein AOCH_003168 [Aspergillus ochraceoroseus]PTU20669.1 hypothetical protein P175DRAFT_0557352 [Aspergillus ochraceoroseus IBT 24754]